LPRLARVSSVLFGGAGWVGVSFLDGVFRSVEHMGRAGGRDVLFRWAFCSGAYGIVFADCDSMTNGQPTTPQTAAAMQLLYAAADRVSPEVRAVLFGAITHLSGMTLAQVIGIWESTR
jgi:hypothetical protein